MSYVEELEQKNTAADETIAKLDEQLEVRSEREIFPILILMTLRVERRNSTSRFAFLLEQGNGNNTFPRVRIETTTVFRTVRVSRHCVYEMK